MEELDFQQLLKNCLLQNVRYLLKSKLLQLRIVLLHRQGNIQYYFFLLCFSFLFFFFFNTSEMCTFKELILKIFPWANAQRTGMFTQDILH